MTAEAGRALTAWPLLISLTAIFGTASFALLAANEADRDLRAMTAPLLALWRVLAALTICVSPFALVDVTADMAGVSWKSALALVPQVLAQTHAGRMWQWFLPAACLLVLTAWAPLGRSIRAAALVVLSGGLLLLQALMSHAIDKGSLAVAVYFVHQIAASLWAGGLLALWGAARYGKTTDQWVKNASRLVSRLAFWSVIALVLSGAYTAYNGLGLDRYHLLFSSYGRILIAKVSVFAIVLAIGAYNRYRLLPDMADASAREALVRNAGLESLILFFAVVGLTSLLANTPPAHGGQADHPMMAMVMADSVRRLKRAGADETEESG